MKKLLTIALLAVTLLATDIKLCANRVATTDPIHGSDGSGIYWW